MALEYSASTKFSNSGQSSSMAFKKRLHSLRKVKGILFMPSLPNNQINPCLSLPRQNPNMAIGLPL
jgi:hypothetical protein